MNRKELASKLVKYRNKKNLSIEEVCKDLKISSNKLKKWESGISKPSLYNLKRISKLYDISISKLIDENKLVNELILKKRLDYLEFLIISVLIFLLIFTTSYITNRKTFNNGKDLIYEFAGEGKNFIFDDGILVINDKTRYIEISDFKLKNNININKMVVNIAFNEKIWKIDEINSCGFDECINWLNNLAFKEYTYNKVPLHKLEKKNSFISYKDSFPNDFKVEINYCTDKECTVDILDVRAKKINIKENK